MASDTLWMNNTALPHPPGSQSDSKTPSISSQGKTRVLWSHQGEHRAVITKSAVSVSSALVYSGLSTPDGFTVSSSCLFSLPPGDTSLSDLPANEARGHCVCVCVCVCGHCHSPVCVRACVCGHCHSPVCSCVCGHCYSPVCVRACVCGHCHLPVCVCVPE